MASWNEHYSNFSNAAGTSVRRVFVFATRTQSLWTRALACLLVCALVGLALVILIPITVLGALTIGLMWLGAGIQGLFRRAREPNGLLDQRRNVRVIRRDNRNWP